MAGVLPIAEAASRPEDLVVLRKVLLGLLESAGTEKTVDTVLVLVARLLREQARLSGKLALLLRRHAESGGEKLGAEQLKLWSDCADRGG